MGVTSVLVFCERSDDEVVIEGIIFDAYPIANQPYTINADSQFGCDSLINVYTEILDTSKVRLKYSLCENSDSTFIVNGNVYGIENLSGEELMTNQLGCDSTVIINIELNPTFAHEEYYQLCRGDSIQILESWFHQDNLNEMFELKTVYNCDSLVEVFVEVLELSESERTEIICHSDSMYVNGGFYFIDEVVTYIISSITVYIESLDMDPFEEEMFQFFVLNGQINTLSLSENLIGEISWYYNDELVCSNCNAYDLDLSKQSGLGELRIIFRNGEGCEYFIPIELEFIKLPYIPNAFSPNGDNNNDVWEMFIDPQLENSDIVVNSFQLFSRTGMLIKTMEDIQLNNSLVLWDGFCGEEVFDQASYYYKIEISYPWFEDQVLTGEVLLVN